MLKSLGFGSRKVRTSSKNREKVLIEKLSFIMIRVGYIRIEM